MEKITTDNFKLLIDGGSPDCDLRLQSRVRDYVEAGGKLLMWSNSFRFDKENRTTLIQDYLGIEGDFTQATETPQRLELELREGTTFDMDVYRTYQVRVREGKVMGTIGGEPAAWLIEAGQARLFSSTAYR